MNELKYRLPNDISRCTNTKCTLKSKCKRSLEHHPPAIYTVSEFSMNENGTCDNQIKLT